jgi:diadenosine tetraphosphatase ApaH/serine/threonine PP2A family protein phosphatase
MRIAVLSDIHANLVALEAVIDSLGSVDRVWQLGDVVGYGPEPDGVVERLKGLNAQGVRGNHDTTAVSGEGLDWFNPEARAAIEWTRSTITNATRTWLAALPAHWQDEERGTDLVHGSPRDPLWEYITSGNVARANIDVLSPATPIGLHGHTHVPAAWRADENGRLGLMRPANGDRLELDGRPMLLNPGSVGQPRDGDPSASYLVLDTDDGSATWHRVGYSIAATQDSMRRAQLPFRLIERLSYGV